MGVQGVITPCRSKLAVMRQGKIYRRKVKMKNIRFKTLSTKDTGSIFYLSIRPPHKDKDYEKKRECLFLEKNSLNNIITYVFYNNEIKEEKVITQPKTKNYLLEV
jgi:hypothetical protein